MKLLTHTKFVLGLVIIIFIMTSCEALTGKEIARIPVNELSVDSNLVVKEVSIDLKKGDKISFWSDMDMEYEGDVKLFFQIEVFKGDERLGLLEFDPTEKKITIGEKKISLINKTTWSFTGKNSDMDIEEDATYTFKAILIASLNHTLKLKKAEIIIKK